jgi:hypothetical protein
VNLSAGVKSDVGRIRSGNEDAYISDAPVFGVADGMGGHVAGDVASSTAIDTIKKNLGSLSSKDPESLAALLRAANGAVWEKASSDAGLRGMGTTCTIAFINDTRAHIAHVGDSRAYRLRDGRLEQLTEDHTLVARMVKEGKLRPEEAEFAEDLASPGYFRWQLDSEEADVACLLLTGSVRPSVLSAKGFHRFTVGVSLGLELGDVLLGLIRAGADRRHGVHERRPRPADRPARGRYCAT